MRFSVNVDDPGYQPYWELRASGREAYVFLDGVEQKMCLTVDDADGLVERIQSDETGRARSNDGEVLRETVRGSVAIELRPR